MMRIFRNTTDDPGKEINESDEVDKRPAISLWMKLFHLPSEPVWFTTVTVLNFITVIGKLYLSVNAKCVTLLREMKMSQIFYLLDIFYLCDIILILGSKYIRNLDLPQINLSMRPLTMLIVEIISLLPLELMTSNDKLVCILHTNRCIRIARILHIFRQYRNMLDSKLFMQIVEMFSNILFITMITYTIYCNIKCWEKVCGETHDCHNEKALVMISTKVTLSGLCKLRSYEVHFEFLTMLAGLISFFFVVTITLVIMMIGIVNINDHQMAYEDKYNSTMLTLNVLDVPDYLKKSTMEVYNTFWVNCGGYNVNCDFLEILPKTVKNGIMVDVYWPALQHSKLFRAMDLPFLRSTSLSMKRSFMMPGDFVYRKNDWKSKMIFLVSGTIQLLSEEDGETPILSFTSGTCLGASSLVVSYKSINSVRCKTFCEFHVLSKSDFIRMFRRFPKHVKNIIHTINDRYRHAKQCNELANHAKKKLSDLERQIDIYTIFWLKNTLHQLMVRDAETMYKHEFQNIYLLNEINENNFNRLLFTAHFLESLAISDRIETDTDTVFAKSTFPCILQPNSVLIILWESLIICFTVLISFTIPYASFVSQVSPEWYTLLVYMSTLVFWCDIYVQVSTAIKTKQGNIIKIRLITIARMQTLGFWADMFSCVPCEMFAPVLLDSMSSQNSSRLHMNRIFKLWRVERIFRLWERKFNANMILIRFIKFSWVNMYTIFVLYCYIHNMKDVPPDSILFSAVQITTGMGIVDGDFTMKNTISIFADTTTTLINLMMYAYIGSAYILDKFRLVEVQQLCKAIAEKIHFRKISPLLIERVTNYVETQMMENGCEQIKNSRSILLNMSEMCYSETMENMIGHVLQTMPLLQNIEDEIILDMCSKLYLMSLPPNEVLTHAGDLVNDILIYYKGVSHVFNRTGQLVHVIDCSQTLNVLESVFTVPSLNTTITKTHCRFFVLPYTAFLQILTKYPSELKCLNDAVAQSADIKTEYLQCCKQSVKTMKYEERKVEQLIHFFGYNLIVDSYEEYDYNLPFDYLYPFAFIRYLLLRITFMPHGKFVCMWESFRCAFAILSSILYFTLPFVNTQYRFVLLALNFTALVDIYFRMHVCYYNENGILVKHPLKTATHYLTHGFLIDFFACLPFGIWTMAKESTFYFTLHLNILFQLHRYFQFINYLRINSLMPSSKWHSISYIPIVFILCNLLGCLLIGVECRYNWEDVQYNENFTAGIKCKPDSLLSVSKFQKPIDPFRAHFYGIYVVTSMITMVGMQGWNHGNNFTRTMIMMLPVIGLYLSVTISAKVFQLYSFRSNALIHYQEGMHSLTNFLHKHNVSHKLCGTIIEHYELKWTRVKGTYMYELVRPFPHSMRLDILFEIISKNIYINSPFESSNLIFYRNISPYLVYEIVLKGGYITTINDITEHLYVVMSGAVDILAPDGTKLDTLYQGSMFGNLDNIKSARQMVSTVASCHVEILSVKARKFHQFLSHDEAMKREFRLIKAKYVSYIPSRKSKIEYKRTIATNSNTTVSYFLSVLNPNSKSMQVWDALNLIISCYLGILLDLYQLGAGDFSTIIIILQYTSDLVYTLHVLTKRYTAYVDEFGNLIVNLEMIRKKSEENKLKFWITLISLIPADVFALVSRLEVNSAHLLYSLLRLNRLLRLTYIFDYFKSTSQKLNVNLGMLRFGYILIWSSLALNAMCAIMGILSCLINVNMHPHMQSCEDLNKLTQLQKFEMYVHYLYIVGNCVTLTSQHFYYPQGLWHIILCICFMFTGQYIRICIISQIFSLLNNKTLQKFKFKNLFEQVMYFLQTEDVSASMITMVTTYINLLWIQQNGVICPKLLHEAPTYLLDAIYNNAFAYLLVDHPIFFNCHPDCLRQIVQKLQYRTYFVGNYVQFKGSIDDTMYFINEGQVAILDEEYLKNKGVIINLYGGESFGIKQGLYHRTPHRFTYRCVKRTIILSLCIDDWAYLLDFFPASKEQLYKLASVYNGL